MFVSFLFLVLSPPLVDRISCPRRCLWCTPVARQQTYFIIVTRSDFVTWRPNSNCTARNRRLELHFVRSVHVPTHKPCWLINAFTNPLPTYLATPNQFTTYKKRQQPLKLDPVPTTCSQLMLFWSVLVTASPTTFPRLAAIDCQFNYAGRLVIYGFIII